MTEITAMPFDWNDNLSKEAIEDFEDMQKDLPYCTCQNIGMALAKLELLENQGCKINQWISVSEKLPDKFRYVNCTCHSLIDDREDWVVETVYIPQPSNSPYSDWGNIPMLNDGDCEVVAWMYRYIPEPYNAEKGGQGMSYKENIRAILECHFTGFKKEIISSACNRILELEPKIGHWIRVADKTGHLVWECDKCGWQQRFHTNFCPDCGAKMIESQEEKEQ